MPPKVKITREDIVNAAVDIVRKNGGEVEQMDFDDLEEIGEESF